ncbi:MAG: DUF3857 domain-containing protein [Candidatus Muirbacterium halophilum]|nr:DUF3857 domain-containing protein [Candidatus Muirbacterium halophilum]MCK9474590.1 DUF3857 domain-containing protein [Candidatus Muirbacterium halophilum]
MKKLLFLLLIICINIAVFTDVVFLNNGEEINGDIYKIDNEKIYLKTDDKVMSFFKDEVLRLELPKYREIKGEYKVNDIKDKYIRDIIKKAPKISDYPDSNYVTLLDKTEYYIDENYINTVKHRRIELICKERAKSRGTIPGNYFDSDNKKIDILFGRTINNGDISYVDDFSIKKSSIFSYYAEYDDLKQLILSLPKVDVGSIIDYEIESVSKEDTNVTKGIYDNIYLSLDEPCLEKKFIISFPLKMQDKFYIEGFNTDNLNIDKKIKNDRVVYTIINKNINALLPEENMPPFWTYGKVIKWDLANITFNEQMKQLKKSYEESEKHSEIVDVVLAEITAEQSSEEEKLHSIFKYINREINDLNIIMKYSKYYPHNISITLKNKRGNTLDRLNLFRVMLKKSGIKSEILYLASKDNFHFEKKPKIEKFDFPILCVTINNKEMFIRANSNLSSLCDRIVGKYYSLNINTGEYKEIDFDNENIVDSNSYIAGTLSKNGDMEFDITLEYFNGAGSSYRKYRYTKQDDIINDMQKFVKYYHSSAKLIDFSFENLDSIDKDVILKVKCKIEDFAQKTGDKLLMFRLPIYFEVSSLGQEERMFDYSISNTISTENTEFKITIPEGYKIYSAPSIRNFSIYDYFTINSEVNLKDREFKLNYSEINKKSLLKKEHYPNYKKAYENLSRWSEEYIVLEKK